MYKLLQLELCRTLVARLLTRDDDSVLMYKVVKVHRRVDAKPYSCNFTAVKAHFKSFNDYSLESISLVDGSIARQRFQNVFMPPDFTSSTSRRSLEHLRAGS